MVDHWSLLINAFTALGTIFLIWWLQTRPEKKRIEKEKDIDLQTELLLLLKKLCDMGLQISKEFIDVPKNISYMLFTSEAKYVDKKIRMHVEKIPSAIGKIEFKDALEEFIYILSKISRTFYKKEKSVSQSEFELCMSTYEELQLAITKSIAII